MTISSVWQLLGLWKQRFGRNGHHLKALSWRWEAAWVTPHWVSQSAAWASVSPGSAALQDQKCDVLHLQGRWCQTAWYDGLTKPGCPTRTSHLTFHHVCSLQAKTIHREKSHGQRCSSVHIFSSSALVHLPKSRMSDVGEFQALITSSKVQSGCDFFSPEFSELWIQAHVSNLGLLVWKLNAFQTQC